MAGHCSWLFVTGCTIVCLGICVIGTALGTLAITSSFIRVFPFGTPLWTGTLFLILGGFMFVAYQPTKFQLPASSRNRIWFTLVLSIFGAVESVLAISLFLWYRTAVYPALRQCSPDLSSFPSSPSPSSSPPLHAESVMICECAGDFIDPPSLRTTIYEFVGVSDCSSLGDTLGLFHWVLLGLYSAGVILVALAGFLAARRLHSSGVCGKSGVYAVSPERTTPVPDSAVSHHPYVNTSPGHSVGVATIAGSSHSVTNLPGFTVNQRLGASSISSLYSHSPSTVRPPRMRHFSCQSTAV